MTRFATTLFLVAAVAALAGAGCAREGTGTAAAEPPAHEFPNLDQFAPVDVAPFRSEERGGPVIQFSTTAGVQCKITLASPSCGGRFSADAYGPGDTPCATVFVESYAPDGTPDPYEIQRSGDDCTSNEAPSYRVLEPGSKLVVDWGPGQGRYVCAVGPVDRVACIDEQHHQGFVIEPSGAWTF